jgi:hypothetical protein
VQLHIGPSESPSNIEKKGMWRSKGK